KNYKAPSSVDEAKPEAKAKQLKQWRCKVCDVEVALESQLRAHVGEHKPCPKPGCKFSAAKRVVTQHVQTVHKGTKQPSQDSKPPAVKTPKINQLKQYRCEVCSVEVALKSQLKAHVGQHVSCPEPDCKFSAAKKAVTKHVESAHKGTKKPSEATSVVHSVAVKPVALLTNKVSTGALFGRCEACNADFAFDHQEVAHAKQHVVCSAPGCSFAAIKRVVVKHIQDVHGS
ncbi:hypothetical protein Gpo141_00014550, partial [Globisporangium polare]